MTVIAISMVKDEEDIIRATVSHMLTQVDRVLIADNLSTDSTPRILRELGVDVIRDEDPAYRQSFKMTKLAGIAHEMGADFVVPFDADEIWYSPFGKISNILEDVASQWLVASAVLYDHVATALDPDESNPIKRIGWRRKNPGAMPKIACRWRHDLTIAQGNHSAHYEGGATVRDGQLVVRHFPYRSAQQFVAKARSGAAAYKAAPDIPFSVGQHWRSYGAIADAYGDEACADIFRKWFWVKDPMSDESLIYDPAPI